MLQLLRDPEVSKFVLEYILDTPNGRRSVSRLSRTCKAISEPALTVLWKELDSLIPLLSLMPNNLFKRARRPGMGFVKNPETKDWDRLIAYGERVRKITYNETVGNIHASIFSVIEDCKPQEYILPNLKMLVWKAESAEGLERSLLFLTPQLRCLTVEIGSGIPQDEFVEFLTEVSSSTRLTALSVTSPTRIPHNLPRLLQQQTTLEKVAILTPGCLSPSIGRWLSSMASLNDLQIEVGDRSDGVIASFFSGMPSSGAQSSGIMSPDSIMTPMMDHAPTQITGFTQDPGFKQLRRLSLTGELGSATNFLSRVSAPLQTIELALDEPEEAKEWHSLWVAVSRQFRNSLRSLCVAASGSSRFNDLIRSTARGENAARRLRLDGLELFPLLARFELDLPESRVFLNEDLLHLASACPHVEIVKLCPLSRWPLPYGPPKATLAGLAPLTTLCKRLHTLHIPIHGVGSEDASIFDMETSSRSLERLHVGHSWVGDPLGASIVLSHLAPYMENLKWFHEKNRPGYVEAHDVGWQRVSEILPQLQGLRLHERSQLSTAKLVPVPVVQSQPQPPPPPPPVKEMVSRTVQAKYQTADFGMQTKVMVRNKAISTKAYQRDVIVDATPSICEQAVEAFPLLQEQAVEAIPLMDSKLVETTDVLSTLNPVSLPVSHREEFDEKFPERMPGAVTHAAAYPEESGYMGQTVGYITQILHAVSPPILWRFFNLWSMFSLDSEKVCDDDAVASMRSSLMFSPKIDSDP